MSRTSVFENVPPAQMGSWWSQIWSVLLQPTRFFRTLASITDARQWVWMALIILVLTGYSAARADSLAKGTTSSANTPIDTSGSIPGDPFSSGSPEGFADSPPVTQPAAATDSDTADRWTTALKASSNIVLAWFLLAALLCEVSLAKGKAPRLTHNVQIAVWASVPLGVMAALQILYYAAGGKPGAPGLAGLLPEWGRYAKLAHSTRSLMLSAATRTTIFGLWTLSLAYFGARHTLKGQKLVALSVVLIWLLLIVVIPVVAKTIDAKNEEKAAAAETVPPGEGEMMPPDGMTPEEGMPMGGSEAQPATGKIERRVQ